jgi:hypothetical protein
MIRLLSVYGSTAVKELFNREETVKTIRQRQNPKGSNCHHLALCVIFV